MSTFCLVVSFNNLLQAAHTWIESWKPSFFISFFIPTLFLKKKQRGYYYHVRSSVRRYFRLNHWTKSNKIWFELHDEWGVQQHILGPAPWGPGEGSKCQISLKSQ